MNGILRGLALPFWNAQQRRLRTLWRLVIQFIVLIVLLLVSMPIVSTIGISLGLDSSDSSFKLAFGAFQTLMIAGSVLFCSWLIDRRFLKSLGIRMGMDWNREFIAGLAMGGAAMSVLFGVEYAMGWIEILSIGPRGDATVVSLIANQFGWLMLMTSVGISEEFLSRGYQLKNMAEGFRRLGTFPAVVLAAILSSAFFGLLHMGNNNVTTVSILSICLAGIMLAMGRIVTGSLAAPIGLHISWNYFQGPILGFAVSGNEAAESFIQVKQLGDPLWTGGEFGPEAGLLGIIAVCILGAIFFFWPRGRHRQTQSIAAIAHFQNRAGARSIRVEPESPLHI